MSNATLREALEALLARHGDGSNEKAWAEWDTAQAAIAADDAARWTMPPALSEAEVKHIVRTTPGPQGFQAALVRAGWDAAMTTVEASRAAAPQSAEPVARLVQIGDTTTPANRLATLLAEALGPSHPAMDDLAALLLAPPTDAEWQEEAMRLADDYAMRMVSISMGDAPERAKEGREALRAHIATRPQGDEAADALRLRWLCSNPDWHFIERTCQAFVAENSAEFLAELRRVIDARRSIELGPFEQHMAPSTKKEQP